MPLKEAKHVSQFGTFGFIVEYGAEKRISRHSNLSGAVMVGVPTGVMLKIKLTRGPHTFIFPIHICEEVLLAPIFYATVVPLVSWLTIKKLIIDPINRDKQIREQERTRENNKSRIQEMHREARWAVDLMQEMYNRIKTEEERVKGLLIVKALYGKLPLGYSHHHLYDEENEEAVPMAVNVIDVTVPVQCLTKNSKLILQGSSKAQLPGFYDTCIGEDKHLTVKYSFRDQIFTHTIVDNEALILPNTNSQSTSASHS